MAETRPLDAEKRRLLKSITNEQLICQTRGHRWPDVDIESDKPETGIVSNYDRNRGVWEQTEICERCEKQRYRVTLPPGLYPTLTDGVYLPGSQWRYTDPVDWVNFRQEELSRSDKIAEYDFRVRHKFYRVPRGAPKPEALRPEVVS